MTHRQQLRKEVLLQLYGAQPLTVSPATMARTAQRAGLNCTETEVKTECEFLCGQRFADRIEDPASGHVTYKITSTGTLEYERNL